MLSTDFDIEQTRAVTAHLFYAFTENACRHGTHLHLLRCVFNIAWMSRDV
jgi:hypothetical protein